jgi:hypothetical protein
VYKQSVNIKCIDKSNSTCTLSVHQVFIKNDVAFKITIERMIDQIMILKVTLFFDEHLIYM